jgi:hypothetical protein
VTHDVEFVAECGCSVVLMADGRIIMSGDVKKVLTNPDVVKKASLLLPQLAEVSFGLKGLGFPAALSIEEVEEAILERFRRHLLL